MVTHLFMQTKNVKEIYLWSAILGVLMIMGLVVALLKDDLIEYVSLIGLIIPIVVIMYFYWIKN